MKNLELRRKMPKSFDLKNLTQLSEKKNTKRSENTENATRESRPPPLPSRKKCAPMILLLARLG